MIRFAILLLIASLWAAPGFSAQPPEASASNLNCEVKAPDGRRLSLSVEIKSGRIERFSYGSSSGACGISGTRDKRELEWEEAGNVTTVAHYVGKGGKGGKAILQNGTEELKVRLENIDMAYYCESEAPLPEDLTLKKGYPGCFLNQGGSKKE